MAEVLSRRRLLTTMTIIVTIIVFIQR